MGGTTPWTTADIPDLRGRTAVVTGASAGLGLETARRLAERGAEVILACRSTERAAAAAAAIRQAVPGAQLPILRLDLASQRSVREAADRLHARYEHLDLLINNAGTLARTRSRTDDGFETVFATNHLGPFAFTGLILSLLMAAPNGRVVTVSSGTSGYRTTKLDLDDLHYERRAYRAFRVYGQSKLANLLFAFELQRRLNDIDTRLVAVAAYPGVAHTDFSRNLSPALRRVLTAPLLDKLLRPIVQSAEMGALPTLRAATDPAVRGGEYFGPARRVTGYPVLCEAGEQAHDLTLAAELWAASERLTGVVFDFGPTARN
ncbi:oxidoreductase [Nocardia sp. NPDC046763]|uniref:oxidoreductase n=1 Tax=Nocardia sp. NPDC046763 TaxID=3155256 RepID=UPI0033F17FC8